MVGFLPEGLVHQARGCLQIGTYTLSGAALGATVVIPEGFVKGVCFRVCGRSMDPSKPEQTDDSDKLRSMAIQLSLSIAIGH